MKIVSKVDQQQPEGLELDSETMEQFGKQALTAVLRFLSDLPGAPVIAPNLRHAEDISRDLYAEAPEEGRAYDELLEFVMREVMPQAMNTGHPGFMGFIPSHSVFPTAIAGLIQAGVNRHVGGWYGAPAAVRLETNVVEWIRDWMGYPEQACGILTSGGTMANLSAVVTARVQLLGDDLVHGTVYASDQIHHSINKACRLARIPAEDIRILPSDENGRAIPEAFLDAIRDDMRQGKKPFLIIGNAGTTNSGSVDPLSDLAQISAEHSLWFHVDAAYGGFFNLCPTGRARLKGIEHADSITLDPHKGLFMPYGTGGLLVKEGDRLRQAHSLRADYYQDYRTPSGEMSFHEYSPEGSRPFRGLGVWLAIQMFGLSAFRETLAEKLLLTDWIHRKLQQEDRCDCPVSPDLSIVTFRFVPEHGDHDEFNRTLLENINATGKIFLSSTSFKGKYTLRMAILGYRTHFDQVEQALRIIISAARALLQSPQYRC